MNLLWLYITLGFLSTHLLAILYLALYDDLKG